MSTVRYHLVNSLAVESGPFDRFPTRSYRAKTSMCRDESRSSSDSPVSQAPCLEIEGALH
jgi:hypothetical protein